MEKVLIKENKESKDYFLTNLEKSKEVIDQVLIKVNKMGMSLTELELKQLFDKSFVGFHADKPTVEYSDNISSYLKEVFKSKNESVKGLPINSDVIKLEGLKSLIDYLFKQAVSSNNVIINFIHCFVINEDGTAAYNEDIVNSKLESFKVYAETNEEAVLFSEMNSICVKINSFLEKRQKAFSASTTIYMDGFKFDGNNNKLKVDVMFIKRYASKMQ